MPRDARGRARLRALRAQVSDLVVPAAVLAEGLFTGHPGHDFHLGRLLSLVDVAPLDRPLGLEAGRLRQRALAAQADPPPSAVDAVVVAVADAMAARDDVVIVTSDADDLELLGSLAEHAHRLFVQPA